ncbi:hypothetical protein AALP_AA7G055900 [Arabis alpina]|uniref:Uncharacterized protein n=1 Tax=Arabis alpina TaxID=50452 RepID=A0A087GG42_ARAAL|nr:hypothetical protein AALP_AA7G055900 [Arabis alpina]
MLKGSGVVPDESNKPKGPGDASRSKGKGKVDLVDNKADKKRISAKVKADLEAGRISIFRISGTCEVLPSEAPVTQSLGVAPPASAPAGSSSLAIPPCSAVQTAVNVPQPPLPRAHSLTPLSRSASELSAYEAEVQSRGDRIKNFASRSDVDAAWKEVGREKHRADSWEAIDFENQESLHEFFDQANALKEEKPKLEEEVKKRDAHLKDASAEIAILGASLEKSRLTEDRLRKERDEARRRADEIASGNSTRNARHSSRLERLRSYLIALHAQEEAKAQLCYKRWTQISLEKMVEAEYELPPALFENYAKEEEEYLVKVDSFNVDSLGDDILFPSLSPPPAGPPRDVASQVPEGIREHGSFLSPQDNQNGN